jgi:hypothetical protein
VIYAMQYLEQGDIIGTYRSREEALRDLREFVSQQPGMENAIGLRPFEDGVPVGELEMAPDLIGDHRAQPHLL